MGPLLQQALVRAGLSYTKMCVRSHQPLTEAQVRLYSDVQRSEDSP